MKGGRTSHENEPVSVPVSDADLFPQAERDGDKNVVIDRKVTYVLKFTYCCIQSFN